MDCQAHNDSSCRCPARGLTAVGVFLLFGMTIAGLAGATLLWRGTAFDRIWALNPTAYARLAPLGRPVGAAFLLLALAMGMAAAGWFLRRGWGWRLTVAIIATQVVADLFNLLRGDFLRGPVGLLIAGALLVYLLRSSVRQAFPAHESRR